MARVVKDKPELTEVKRNEEHKRAYIKVWVLLVKWLWSVAEAQW